MELIMGTAQLVRPYGRVTTSTYPTRDSALELLRHAFDCGIRTLDTAPSYGEAEQTIGASGLDFRIHTKVGPGQSVRDSVSRSLQLLRREAIDVLYLHDATELFNPESTLLAEAAELIGDSIAAVGVSIYTVDEFDAALTNPRISVVQIPLNALDRRIDDDRLLRATKNGIRVVVRSVYLQGLLVNSLGNIRPVHESLTKSIAAFQQLARALGRTPAELAIGWVAARPGVSSITVGIDSPQNLDDLLESMEASLSSEALEQVRGLPVPARRLLDPRNWDAG